MEKKYLLYEHFTKINIRFVMGGIVILVAGLLMYGIWFFQHSKDKIIAELELRGEVEQVYQKDPRNLIWWVATLKGLDQEITLVEEMVNNIQPGDSLYKQPGQNFYLLRNHRTGEFKKYLVTQ